MSRSLFPGLTEPLSQRWRNGRDSYRPADDERFEPRHYEVALVTRDADVRPFVARHHYSASLPNSGRYRFVLVDNRLPADERVVGASVFGSPSGPSVLSAAFPFLTSPNQEAAELQRLVLVDEVRKNGESWFVSQCFRTLKLAGLEAVVSYSDPSPRWDADGVVVMPGHVGCVYQALSAWYTGRARARWSWYVAESGHQINERDLTKVRAKCPCCGSGKSADGGLGAVERLVGWGARRPKRGECFRSWLAAVLPTLGERRRHGGNHRYVWGIAKAARKGLVRLHDGQPDSTTYPKTIDPTARPSWAGDDA